MKLPAIAIIWAALLLLALAFTPGVKGFHDWQGFHWSGSSLPVTIDYLDGVSSEWTNDLYGVRDDWNRSDVVQTRIVGGYGGDPSVCDIGKPIPVCNAQYGATNWFGVAVASVDGSNHFQQGAVRLNDSYIGVGTQYGTPEYRRHVICQEYAHIFGLGHQSTDGSSQNSCMDYYFNQAGDTLSTGPNAHDFDELRTVYAHIGGGTTAPTPTPTPTPRPQATQTPTPRPQPTATPAPPPSGTPPLPDAVAGCAGYFLDTGICTPGLFLQYWYDHGGQQQQGLAISPVFYSGGVWVQYFERARFEYHPEVGGQVLLGLLGSEQYRAQYPGGVSAQVSAFAAAPNAHGADRTRVVDKKWGKITEKRGNHSTYEKHEPNGGKVITDVHWNPESDPDSEPDPQP